MTVKLLRRQPDITDLQAVKGLQSKDATIERVFFMECRKYFYERKSGIFETRDGTHGLSDLFQDSFLTLWTEIDSRRIYIRDNNLWRTDRHGHERKMSASLKTYLMAIAKYKNYESLREEEIYVQASPNLADAIIDEPLEDITPEAIVQQCVNELPKRCKEILTLFYYKGKSLDEIMELRQENQSKDGLKTGKSKCMTDLKGRILNEFNRHNLNPIPYASR